MTAPTSHDIPDRQLWLGLDGAAMMIILAVPLIMIGHLTHHPGERIAATWPGPALFLGVASLCWSPQGLRRRQMTHVIAALAGVCVLIGLACGAGVVMVVRTTVVDAAAAMGLLAFYRQFSTASGWFPEERRDVVLLSLGTCGTTAVTVLAGGAPDTVWDGSLVSLCWWTVRIHVALVFGSFTIFALWHGPRPVHSRIALPGALPALAVAGGALLAAPYLVRYPLDWCVFLPAVWIGLTLTPRWACLALDSMAVAVRLLAVSPWSVIDTTGNFPATLLMDLLLCVAATLSLMIVVFREKVARLSAAVRDAGLEEQDRVELLQSVIRSMTDGVLLTTESGRLAMANPAARSVLGAGNRGSLSEDDWVACRGVRTLDGTLLSDEQLRDLLFRQERDVERVTIALRDPASAEDRYFSVTVRRLAHRRDELNLVLLTDTTHEHTRRRQLESFAGTVAHDLKNPLTALSLWVEEAELEIEADPKAGARALERAHSSGERMRHIIDDYLAYTVTREGVLRPSSVPLAQVVTELIAVYGDGPDGPIFTVEGTAIAHADPALVQQVLSNLLGNAVKYAHPDRALAVTVRLGVDDDPGWVRVVVADNGIGLAGVDTESIFEPFARAASGASAHQGVGLGLALCRVVVQRHGGVIRAYPNAAGGATIEFTLPRALALSA
ncbi:Adaptive-response sensory-kinase SasA [Austwickia sp. TVS 96-490-7B]|uniref:sensor histidine kinase n=1 Tax=Austwickia sp. TVS 96-490-7B TaxID=2830843 RepID=UPI001C567B04|nr:PAS domain-containing sensor histidine kinase [Austwickia sp. TVS 96-490-7B]MBW3086261.1 Adaptive-response sensory-kinase SasA [Austwickia sp. TVS 96-490-7B]